MLSCAPTDDGVYIMWANLSLRNQCLKKKKKEQETKDNLTKKGKVPLYFVLYYTLNRSGEIHGKK